MGFPLGESLKCLSNWPSIFEAIIYIFSNMIFILLDFIKVHKKQKFSALDNVESHGKEILSVSYVTCFEIIVLVSLSWWSIFSFLDVLTLILRIIIFWLSDQPDTILLTARTTKNWVAFALTKIYIYLVQENQCFSQ